MAVKLADECWIALAILLKNNPDRGSFSAAEILERMKAEALSPQLRAGAQPHVYQHLVANKQPSSGTYRMFYELPDGTFRLFRPGDDFHPARRGKTMPVRRDIPELFQPLLDWYQNEYCRAGSAGRSHRDPVLAMRGVGKEIWRDEGADAFVLRERGAWDEEVRTRGGPDAERLPKRQRTGRQRG